MQVKVKYLTPIKNVVSNSEDCFELEAATSVDSLVQEIITKYGPPFKDYIISSETGGFTTKKVGIGIQRAGVVGTRRIELLAGFDTPLEDQDLVVLFSPQA